MYVYISSKNILFHKSRESLLVLCEDPLSITRSVKRAIQVEENDDAWSLPYFIALMIPKDLKDGSFSPLDNDLAC